MIGPQVPSHPSRGVPIAIIEIDRFVAASAFLLSDSERMRLLDHLAYHPECGDLIPGTGGVRKVRWALEGRGKRGGLRVVYFYHSPGMPIFVFSAYAKNERADLSQEERNRFRTLIPQIVARYLRRAR